MMLELLVTAAARTSVLAAVIWLATWALRVRQPRLLLISWTAVLAASLAMPMLQSAPALTVATPVSLPPAFAAFAPPAPPATSDPAAAAAADSQPAAAPAPEAFAWRAWLWRLYLAVASVLLLRLIVGLALSWRLLRAAALVRDDWAAGGRVRASAAISTPVTIGRTVMLPADCRDWPDATRLAVLAHERAHIARGDFLVQVLSQLNRALFWFSPVAWLLHRRLVALAELASDDDAIASLGDCRCYAEILLAMARRARPGLAGAVFSGVAMARPVALCRRIERILADHYAPPRGRATRRAAFALAITPLLLAVAVASQAQTPTPALTPTVPPGTAVLLPATPHKAITIDPQLLDAYAGVYRNEKNGHVLIIAREGDHLTSHRAGTLRTPAQMYPYSSHEFFATLTPLDESFVMDPSGKVLRMVIKYGGWSGTAERLSDAEGQQALAAIAQHAAAEQAPHVEVAIDPRLLDAYVGGYRFDTWTMFRVTRDGNALFARLGSQPPIQLHPYTNSDFFYTVAPVQISFVVGADGKANSLVAHNEGQDHTATRVSDAAVLSYDQKLAEQMAPHAKIGINPHLLDGYVGRYRNSELEIAVTRDGDQLSVQVTGFRRYPVYPYSDHDFFATGFAAQVSFTTDGNGHATTLTRHQFGIDEVFTRED